MYTSLRTEDIVQMLLLCMAIFLPLGFIIGVKLRNFKWLSLLLRRLKHGLKDEGSYTEFMGLQKESKD